MVDVVQRACPACGLPARNVFVRHKGESLMRKAGNNATVQPAKPAICLMNNTLLFL